MKIKLAITAAALILGAQSISASTTGALAKATKKLIIENQNMSSQIKENTKNTLENKVSLEEIKIFYKESQVNGESKIARDNRDIAINKLTKNESEASSKNAKQDVMIDALKEKNLNMDLEIGSLKKTQIESAASIDSLKERVQTLEYKLKESIKKVEKNRKDIKGEPSTLVSWFEDPERKSPAISPAGDDKRVSSLLKQFKDFKISQEKALNAKLSKISSLHADVQKIKSENSKLKDTVARYQAQVSNYQAHVQDKLEDIEKKSSISHLKIVERESIVRDCDAPKKRCSDTKHQGDKETALDDAVILDFINN